MELRCLALGFSPSTRFLSGERSAKIQRKFSRFIMNSFSIKSVIPDWNKILNLNPDELAKVRKVLMLECGSCYIAIR